MTQANKRKIASLLRSDGWKPFIEMLNELKQEKERSLKMAPRASVESLAFEWRGFAEAVDKIEGLTNSFKLDTQDTLEEPWISIT